MKLIYAMIFLLIGTTCYSQYELSKENAEIILGEFFKGFHEKDTVRMNRVMSPYAQIQSIYVAKGGDNVLSYGRKPDFYQMIVNRPEDQKWEERILDMEFKEDGSLAHVWVPYEFYLNGKFRHCGANSFTLAFLNEGWKIIYIIDSKRVKGCEKEVGEAIGQ